jgi:hypothetical protein
MRRWSVLYAVASTAQRLHFNDQAALVRMGGVDAISYDPANPTILTLHLPIRALASLPTHDAAQDAQLILDSTSARLSLSATDGSGTLTLSRDAGTQQLTLSGRLALGNGVADCRGTALQPSGSGATAPAAGSAYTFELAPGAGGAASIIFGADTSTAPALVKLAGQSVLWLVGTLQFTAADTSTQLADCDYVPPSSPPSPPPHIHSPHTHVPHSHAPHSHVPHSHSPISITCISSAISECTNRCNGCSCVDLRQDPNHHHVMYLTGTNTAGVSYGLANTYDGSRMWTCSCTSGCSGIVGTWSCPGFYGNIIYVHASRSGNFLNNGNSGYYIENCVT